VQSAWQVYPDDVNIEAARQPLDVLKAFVEVYGIPLRVGNTTSLFIESERHLGGPNITIAATAPPDHYLSASSTTDAQGNVRVGVSYCIDMTRYKTALERHGIKIEPMPTPSALTASTGDVTGGRCSTAKNRRLSLPSIGDDQA
jgi:hypothetical protein